MKYRGGKKKIAAGAEHGFIGETKSKPAPPKPWVEDARISAYKLERDRVLYKLGDAETKEAILKLRNI